MTELTRTRLVRSTLIAIAGFGSQGASAAFVDDSTASLYLRNMYLNRDFRDTANETMKDWAQGFTLRYQSGFTEGTVGFGVDALAQLGVKLDSAQGRSGSGVIPVDRDLTPNDDWSELGVTAKARISDSTLYLGTLQPSLPVVLYNDTRLLAGTYTGGMVNFKEIEGLNANIGRITETNLRDSTSRDDMAYVYNRAESDHLDFAGGAYTLSDQLTASYYYGELDNVYRQHFAGLVHVLPLSDQMSLRTDLRYFKSRDTGDAVGGVIDNDFLNGMVTLSIGGHRFSGAYQRLSGDGNFPFVLGGDPYSVNLSTYNTFTKADTDAWQARYDYDFAALGLPGLTFMTRYVKATGIDAQGTTNGHEWERDTDLVYVFQEGPFRGLDIRLRNAAFRASNGLTGDVDENRIIVGYTLPLF